MTLASARIALLGESPYAHEREAIDFAIQSLPNSDPLHLWALVDLLDPSTGRLHEIDLLVLGYSALYLVEIKSGPGRYEGDVVDWLWTPPGGNQRWMDAPLRLANHKAKVLKSRLMAKMSGPHKAPRVEALVFLSAANLDLCLSPEGRTGVVTRATLVRAITHHEFPGAPADWRGDRIDKPTVRDIAKALEAAGVRKRKGKATVGAYELGEVLEDGPGYQDRLAVHKEHKGFRRRARIYLVPDQTSVERRQLLRRAADREAQLLTDVKDHPNILSVTDFVADAPLGPTVLLDAFEGGVPLDVFLRQNPGLPFFDRVHLVEQVGRALAYCHRRGVFHGSLNPAAVLVRRSDASKALEVRLFNFQLGAGEHAEATSHWTALAQEPWAVYQAPELREDPTAKSAQSDIFSLGALAHLVLTGKPPGANVREVDERLARDRFLDPAAVTDGFDEHARSFITEATQVAFAHRADDVGTWVELLVDTVTRPTEEPAQPEPSPLEATAGAVLGGDLLVLGVLGHGATSRVLSVERGDGRVLALKVSLAPEHDERLAEEAKVLERLGHPRIVQSFGLRTLGGRACLLLSVAGESTLHRLLAKDGSVSLDYASRFGEDLLSALEHLEDQGVVHRDIKPANLGVGSVAKGAQRLTLFDFSLCSSPPGDTSVGTAAYRDPFLKLRGAWDGAADRYSAAVTLHEMLTGVRPSYGGRGGTALDEEARLTLAAERLDPSVRDRLLAFFETALARDVERRFGTARDMRLRWISCFEAKRAPEPASERPSTDPGPGPEVGNEVVAAIGPEVPVAVLPLSLRAKNALDRAGVVRAEDLLLLRDNRLSAIRGIGTLVAQEILKFRDRWRQLRAVSPRDAAPFFPGYRGEDLLLGASALDAASVSALSNAGLLTLAAVASAPKGQLEALEAKHGLRVAPLRALLEEENKAADEREHPSTLEGWVSALLSPKKRVRMRYPRLLFGLDAPFARRLDASVREVAEHTKVTTANVYIQLGKARDEWSAHAAIGELSAVVHELLDAAGFALPLAEAADRLRVRLPHDRSREVEDTRADAAALLRVVAEVEKEAPAGVRYIRLREDVPWIFAAEEHARVVRALGDAADELAQRSPMASPAECGRALAELARGTRLAGASVERLAELAASASRRAARSARLELYPRGMPARRALELSAPVLASGLTPADVRQRVVARYPEAEPLPGRPELDHLLAAHRLVWVEAKGTYERPGEPHATSLGTSFSSLGHRPASRWAPAAAPEVILVEDFDERLAAAVEHRKYTVLAVNADRAREAALALGRRLGVRPAVFDALLFAEMKRLVADLEIAPEVVHQADLAGPEGPEWPNLVKLVRTAADALAGRLLPPREPLLLVQPGLLARFQLDGFLRRLAQASKQDEAAAIFLLVPAHDTGGVPKINGELVIPGLLPGQSLWVPREWLAQHLPQVA